MTNDRFSVMNSFDPDARRAILRQSIGDASPSPTGKQINMHLHSFFSFNAMGYSPTRLAWEARQQGLYAAGLCDFDVLDGLQEFLEAGRLLALRTAVSLETRAFFNEYADREINSPGEPGVTYIMGAGFAREPAASTPAGLFLKDLRNRAAHRNRALVDRINQHLPELAIDYRADVLPLSPAGCPTERHIVRAYCARATAGGQASALRHWSQILQQPSADAAKLIDDRPALEDALRSRLVKRGGLAYEPPTSATFPAVDDFVQWVLEARAIPMATWLDGASAGESDPAAMLDCLCSKGVAAVNIVPDRNWNYRDPQQQRSKVEKLREFVRTATALDLPINIGTEMNKEGQPFCDDLDGPILREFAAAFSHGARIMVGQTLLEGYAGYGYCDPATDADFKGNRQKRNAFFAAVGALPPLTETTERHLASAAPSAALDTIREAVKTGTW